MSDLISTPPQSVEIATEPILNPSAAAYIGQAKAVNTKRAYTSAWHDFVAWCASANVQALPAAPPTVANYVAALADAGAKLSTIRLRMASISKAHEAASQVNPVRTAIVREALQGITRSIGAAQERKDPITVEDLRGMCQAQANNVTGIRNRAMLLVGFAGAFRRSELVSLDVEDVQFKRQEAVITLKRSKTDQEGQGTVKRLPMATDEAICPVRALKTWLKVAQIESGPIFRRVDRWQAVGKDRLTDQVVATVVKGAAQAIGLDPSRVAGHTLRAGFITEAARREVPEYQIAQVSGHKSAVLRRYIRDAGAGQAKAISSVLG